MATGIVSKPYLATGDNLTREEFIEIWEQLPEIKFAELIGGVVNTSSPLRRERAKSDHRLSLWIGTYELATPGCEGGSNATVFMGRDCPQPDEYLAILPEFGGRSWGEEYLEGSPEFLAEISFSTASIDLHQKFDLYEREGVQEYLVVLVKSEEIRWHRLVDGKYQYLRPDASGVYRSVVFPGLWLDSKALFANDLPKLHATLQEGIASDEHQQFVAELAKRMKAIK